MEKCIVHFGMYKTGTTAIQKALANYLDIQRFYYIDIQSHQLLCEAFFDDQMRIKFNKVLKPSDEQLRLRKMEATNHLIQEFEKVGNRIAILSSESLTLFKQNELQKLYKMITNYTKDIVGLCYVRDPKSYMESSFQQILKSKLIDFELDSIYPHYQDRLEKFESIFGKSKCFYYLYDKKHLINGDSVKDFFTKIDHPIVDNIKEINLNKSLSLEAIKLLYLYRKSSYFKISSDIDIYANRKLISLLGTLEGDKFFINNKLITTYLASKKEDIDWITKRVTLPKVGPYAFQNNKTIKSEKDLYKIKLDTIRWLEKECKCKIRLWDLIFRRNQILAQCLHKYFSTMAERALKKSYTQRLIVRRQDTSPFVSIIICTYNRVEFLTKCINALIPQMKKYSQSVEVIVIDNNCNDDTENVTQRMMINYPWLYYFKETKQGLSNARNCGAKSSRGTYLCYLDDDGYPCDDYIEHLMSILHSFEPDIAGGPVYPYYTTHKPDWFKDEFEIRKYAEKSGFCNHCSISGGNYIIKKSLLISLGMFSEKYGMVGNKIRLGEERAVLEHYKSRTPYDKQKVYYSLDCFIFHHVPNEKMKYSYFIKRGFHSGRSAWKIKNKKFKDFKSIVKKLLKNFLIELPSVYLEVGKNKEKIVLFKNMSIQVGNLVGCLETLLLNNKR